jgi:hypothetical protein
LLKIDREIDFNNAHVVTIAKIEREIDFNDAHGITKAKIDHIASYEASF